jgi:hypothetical protein
VASDGAMTTFKSAVGDTFYVCEPQLHYQLQFHNSCSYTGVIDGLKIGEVNGEDYVKMLIIVRKKI